MLTTYVTSLRAWSLTTRDLTLKNIPTAGRYTEREDIFLRKIAESRVISNADTIRGTVATTERHSFLNQVKQAVHF